MGMWHSCCIPILVLQRKNRNANGMRYGFIIYPIPLSSLIRYGTGINNIVVKNNHQKCSLCHRQTFQFSRMILCLSPFLTVGTNEILLQQC
mmetsp:Transcript_28614/g.48692  ORF Transcript_28614/g.48692 Transcript_28614/m.48692 type:complete len:91 (+) Transcript_28614:243-515(+)